MLLGYYFSGSRDQSAWSMQHSLGDAKRSRDMSEGLDEARGTVWGDKIRERPETQCVWTGSELSY